MQASAELAPGSSPDTAYGWQGRVVVAGLVWPGTGPVGYGLQVLDPVTGTPGAPLPVPVPADVSLTGSAAALGPDGVLYVAASRGGGAPVLLAVDPATGDVRASAEVAVDGAASPAEVVDLAVAPDGSRVVLTVTAPGAERFAPSRTLLVTLGPDLAPLRAPVDLAPGFVRSLAVDAVVSGDGTAYAVVRGADADRVDREHVVAVGPDATAPEVLTADGRFAGTPVTEVALDGTTLWVTLQREPAAASVLAVHPRTGQVGTPLELCDELAGRLLAGDSGTLAVAARCDGEAVLWWLDPR